MWLGLMPVQLTDKACWGESTPTRTPADHPQSESDAGLPEEEVIVKDELSLANKRRGRERLAGSYGRVMYVGRANALRQRIEHHTHYHHRGRHRTTSLLASSLANNMAARATGRRMDAGDPLFREAVLEAAARIRERMEVRWLLVADPEARSACERAAIKRFRPEYNRQR